VTSANSEIEKIPQPSSLEVEPPAQVVGVWHPPPAYPPPRAQAPRSTEGRAIAALIAAIAGIVLGLPLGLPGMILGTLAYFLGKSAVSRIDSGQGALGGRGLATASWVLGAIAMGIGAVVTLAWLVLLLNSMTQITTG
jgi:hypothetical protein